MIGGNGDLADVILKSTWAPAQALGRGDDLGTLKRGAPADIFVFDLEEGSFPLEDTHLRTESASRRIKPFLTIKDGISSNQAVIRFACGNYTNATMISSGS
jgi:predicted amidohydrolase